MFNPIDKGKTENIQGLICHLPPIGMVYNILSGQVEERIIYARSPKKDEQYFEYVSLPKDYQKLRAKEIQRQEEDPEFFDAKLEQFRQQEWDRRLNGYWFYNNGVPTYITGLHYFYLN